MRGVCRHPVLIAGHDYVCRCDVLRFVDSSVIVRVAEERWRDTMGVVRASLGRGGKSLQTFVECGRFCNVSKNENVLDRKVW